MTPAEAIDRIREILAQMDEREPDIFGELPPATDGKLCEVCGHIMQRNGRCWRCSNCGNAGACD